MTTPTEREALIAWQLDRVKKYKSAGHEGLAELFQKTADMLTTDAQEIALLTGTLESRERNIETLQAENVRLLQAWDDTLRIANDAKPVIERLASERDALQAERVPMTADANSISAQAEREACAQECMKEMKFMTGVAQKHPEDSPARDRAHAAARSALRCADRIRSRAGFQ